MSRQAVLSRQLAAMVAAQDVLAAHPRVIPILGAGLVAELQEDSAEHRVRLEVLVWFGLVEALAERPPARVFGGLGPLAPPSCRRRLRR